MANTPPRRDGSMTHGKLLASDKDGMDLGCAGCGFAKAGDISTEASTGVTLVFGVALVGLFFLVTMLTAAGYDNLESLIVLLGVLLVPGTVLVAKRGWRSVVSILDSR